MKRLKDYIIQFVGLEAGKHQFEFTINDKFFEHFEYSLIQHGKIDITVDLDKSERMMIFNINLIGDVEVSCDRCNGNLILHISDSQKLIVKPGEAYSDEGEDVITIPENEHEFDFAVHFYEFIHLALPARLLHPDDENGNSTCDPEMLKLLNKLAPAEHTDSRWDVLQNLAPQDE